MAYTDAEHQVTLVDLNQVSRRFLLARPSLKANLLGTNRKQHPRLIQLRHSPHAIDPGRTRSGATAMCSATASHSGAPQRFLTGGCGGADKSVYLWTVRPSHSQVYKAWSSRIAVKHTSAVHALAYMRHRNSVISAGADLGFSVSDIEKGLIRKHDLLDGAGEVYQLHTSGSDDSASLILCEVSFWHAKNILDGLTSGVSCHQLRHTRETLVFDLRNMVEHVARLGPKPKVLSTPSDASASKERRTRYNRGCFTGDLFWRGASVYDLRNTCQTVRHLLPMTDLLVG